MNSSFYEFINNETREKLTSFRQKITECQRKSKGGGEISNSLKLRKEAREDLSIYLCKKSLNSGNIKIAKASR